MRVHASASATTKDEVLAKIREQLKIAQKHEDEIRIAPGAVATGEDGILRDNPYAAMLAAQVQAQLGELPDLAGKLYRVLVNLDLPGGPMAEYSSAAVTCDIIKPS